MQRRRFFGVPQAVPIDPGSGALPRIGARTRYPLGGAPSKEPFTLPANQGPETNPNATFLRPGIGNLGVPQSVIDVADYPGGAQTNFYTVGPIDILAINRPSAGQLRSILLLKNSPASPAGSELYVAFGTAAIDETSWFSIPPGGMIYLDGKVPQDDVHIAGSVAGVLAIIGYANFLIQPGT